MSTRDRLPDLLLERYRLGELSRSESLAVEERLVVDADARERLGRIEDSDRQIHATGVPERLAAQVRTRLAARRLPALASRAAEPPRRAIAHGFLPSAVLAAAAALVLVIVARTPWSRPIAEPLATPAAPGGTGAATGPASTPLPQGSPAGGDAGERLKGSRPALLVFRRTAAGSESLADGARTRHGDVVRLGYRAAGAAYGAIVSVDGRGSLTQHLPARGSQAVRLRGGRVLLDESYELDDAPRFERFYLVVSAAAFELAPLREAARRAATSPSPRRLELPDGLEQATFSLEKEEGR